MDLYKSEMKTTKMIRCRHVVRDKKSGTFPLFLSGSTVRGGARPAGGGVWAWCAVKQGKIRQIFGRIFQQAVLSDMCCTDVQQQSSCEETLSTQGQCCNPVSNFSSNLAICDMMGVVKNRCPILSLFCLRPPYIYIWSNWSIAPKWPQYHVGLFQAKAETFPN